MTKYTVKVFVSEYTRIDEEYKAVEVKKAFVYHDADDVHGLIDCLMTGNKSNKFEIDTEEVGDE